MTDDEQIKSDEWMGFRLSMDAYTWGWGMAVEWMDGYMDVEQVDEWMLSEQTDGCYMGRQMGIEWVDGLMIVEWVQRQMLSEWTGGC